MQQLTLKHTPYLPVIPVLVGLIIGLLPEFMPGLLLFASIGLSVWLAYVTTEQFGLTLFPLLPQKSGSYVFYIFSTIAWNSVGEDYDWPVALFAIGFTVALIWEIREKMDHPFQT